MALVMSDIILQVSNLTKDFSTIRAVDNVSFAVPRGKVIGLLGPNGAGKTSTIQMLIGITTPTSGEIKYFGKEFYKHKAQCLSKINFTSAYNTLQGRISVWENLVVFSHLYNVSDHESKIKKLIDYFEIAPLAHRRLWDLSAGQKTRVNLVKSLLNDPELILMDEPTASLDPDIADKTLSLIEKLQRERSLSILYTSHNMQEVTRICDEVIFLDHGKIVAHDTPVGLTKHIAHSTLRLTFDKKYPSVDTFLSENRLKFLYNNPRVVTINLKETDIPKIIFKISQLGVWITDIEVEKPTLDDVFLQIARGGDL